MPNLKYYRWWLQGKFSRVNNLSIFIQLPVPINKISNYVKRKTPKRTWIMSYAIDRCTFQFLFSCLSVQFNLIELQKNSTTSVYLDTYIYRCLLKNVTNRQNLIKKKIITKEKKKIEYTTEGDHRHIFDLLFFWKKQNNKFL